MQFHLDGGQAGRGACSSSRGRVLGTFTIMMIPIPEQAETAPLSFRHAAKKTGVVVDLPYYDN